MTLMLFSIADGFEAFGRSFNFSEFPVLQEVNFTFAVGWKEVGLPWIPAALSTLRPATLHVYPLSGLPSQARLFSTSPSKH